MTSEKEKTDKKETDRLEFFSDGVFAIAITLLIIEVKVPTEEELHLGLLNALLNKWPHYLAFFIGFFTVFVCWINHHHAFLHITKCTETFCIVNALLLFVVGFVSFPTAVLADFINHEESETAVHLYGITYIMMAAAYRILWGFAYKHNLTYTSTQEHFKKAVKRMYDLGIIHTVVAFIISFWSVPLSLVLYSLLFTMFMIPATYTKLIMKYDKTLQKK